MNDTPGLPLCAVMGVIAGHPMACGDCDPCGAAHLVAEPIRRLLDELREWMDRYSDAATRAEAAEAKAAELEKELADCDKANGGRMVALAAAEARIAELMQERDEPTSHDLGPRLDAAREAIASEPGDEGFYTEEMVERLIIAAANDYAAAIADGQRRLATCNREMTSALVRAEAAEAEVARLTTPLEGAKVSAEELERMREAPGLMGNRSLDRLIDSLHHATAQVRLAREDWVSVDDQMPPPHQNVWCLNRDNRQFVGRVCYGMHKPFFTYPYGDGSASNTAPGWIAVTHWRMLPDAAAIRNRETDNG